MRRVAFMNQKGGVGKTTTVANLGAALAEMGRRILAVDVDPQANLTTHLDHTLTIDGPTVYEVLVGRATASEAIIPTSTERLALLPSTIDLSGAEIELVSQMGRETVLRDALEEHFRDQSDYDFVLIDCPPSLGLLSLNALTTVTEVMIPIQTQFFALRGMSKLLDVIELVRRRLRPELEVTAIIPSIADFRTNLTVEVLQEIRDYFGDKVTRTVIRTNVRLAEAPSHGKTILQYDSSSRGAACFRDLAKEILGELAPDLERTPGPSTEEARELPTFRPIPFEELPIALPGPSASEGEPPGAAERNVLPG